MIAVAGVRIVGVGQNPDNNTIDLFLDDLNIVGSWKAVTIKIGVKVATDESVASDENIFAAAAENFHRRVRQ